jgi:hypothetical protein
MSILRSSAALALPALLAFSYLAVHTRAVVDAGTAPHLELEDVVRHARIAFVGTVQSALARQAADGLIETEYSLAVEQRFVGDGGPSQTVVLPGGVLADGRGLVLPGVPQLAVGEEVVLFLSERDARSGRHMPVGLEQGRYRLVLGTDGVRRAIGAGPSYALDVSGAPHDAAVSQSYQSLRARIEAALQSAPKESR